MARDEMMKKVMHEHRYSNTLTIGEGKRSKVKIVVSDDINEDPDHERLVKQFRRRVRDVKQRPASRPLTAVG